MPLQIEKDEIGIAGQLAGCATVVDVRERLAKLYSPEDWWLYEGPKRVRLHRAPRGGRIGRLLGLMKSRAVFSAAEV
jgi:hypothetical protein